MKLREAAGEINRAKQVRIWVEIDLDHEEGGLHVRLEKVAAKEIIEHCRNNGIDEINAVVDGGILYIEAFNDEDGEEEGEPGEEEEPEEEAPEEELAT